MLICYDIDNMCHVCRSKIRSMVYIYWYYRLNTHR